MQLRWGVISEFDAEKWLVKVNFEEAGIVSGWLQLLTRGSQDTKEEFPADQGAMVACLVDEYMERGVVLGTAYNETDTPDLKNKDKYQVKYKDGTFESYDQADHKKYIKNDSCEFIITRTGFTIKKSSNSIKTLMEEIIDQIKLITVTTPNGPSGTPINATAFDAIKEKVGLLMEA